jgi:rhodanese-related sulfurtransferase
MPGAKYIYPMPQISAMRFIAPERCNQSAIAGRDTDIDHSVSEEYGRQPQSKIKEARTKAKFLHLINNHQTGRRLLIMKKTKVSTVIIMLGAVFGIALSSTAFADDPPDGNRYFSLPRYYKSEISVSDTYLAMTNHRHQKNEAKPVLIDVRTLREYASGHPIGAYNVPFPHIITKNDQDPLTLYWEVYRIVHGRMDTPIFTLCRTGHRSVLAGNILADPESNDATKGQGLQPFTNVRNIWEGFVGQPKYAFKTGSSSLELFLDADGVPHGYQLDLNNNGVIDSDTADVYVETKDANPDKDGWRNFAGLPWTTRIRPSRAYEQNPANYTALNLTPVNPPEHGHHHWH